ncbi:hypothetical protein BD410DRAFT_362496 [Rickenella mellea]|uniref:Uncharacterized protein n=1 Tax=Rickenella mellea TaxID=50990 RepID=A0A4Y7Q0H6_9AGAM|nr:hypothetical protein BD410DRAFT_362496 [Rickenella mellea]
MDIYDLPGGQNNNENRLPPINQLPLEILTEIFFHSLANGAIKQNRGNSVDTSPVVLGHICRAWRTLALSSPLLWATINVTVMTGWGVLVDVDRTLLAVEELLIRSQDCPLKIAMRYVHYPYGPDEEDSHSFRIRYEAIVAKLLSHSHRWKHVELSLPKASVGAVFERISAGTPLLTYFLIAESQNTTESMTINLSSATQLECLRILLPVRIDWGGSMMHKMRKFSSISYPTVYAFLECFDRCPSLTDFYFHSHMQRPSPHFTRTQMSLRRLSYLVNCSLEHLYQAQYSAMLNWLDLPSLRNFSLSTTEVPSDPSTLERFLLRSQPPLEVFSIFVRGMTNPELHACLRIVPSLTTLRCATIHFTEESVEAFMVPPPPDGESVLCPNLESVWINNESEVACRAIAKLMVNRRRNALTTGAARVRVFGLDPGNFEAFKGYPGIQQCVDEGLQLRDKFWWHDHRDSNK